MRVPYGLLALGLAQAGAVVLLPQCSPEELVYERGSGSPDAASDTGGGTGVGGTAGWAEICGNGIDDDQNGKTDCEDPVCSSYACVDLAPSGWEGPVAVLTAPNGSLPDCPKGLTSVLTGGSEPTFEPASCGTCSCGSPTGGGCDIQATYYSDSACSVSESGGPVGSACSATFTDIVASMRVDAFPSGSCGAGSSPPPTLSTPVFANQVRACALAEGGTTAGCEAGKVCAPLSSEALACVYRTGDVACPSGYPDRRLIHGSFTDSRACGACACAFAADGCSFQLTGYQNMNCTSPSLTATVTGCYVANVHSSSVSGPVPINARCDPATPTPSGCAAAVNPTTLCCTGGSGSACPSGAGPDMVRVIAPDGGSYCVDTTEVTRKQYAAFLATNPTAANLPSFCAWDTSFNIPFGDGFDDSPVTYVDWCDAYAYCAWAGKRLCGKIGGGTVTQASSASDSQWYNACSLGGTRKYPYGNVLAPGACSPTFLGLPVQSSPCCQGGFSGLYDMVGNVSEWEDGCQIKDAKGNNDLCFVRGKTSCDESSTAQRDHKSMSVGFRCCAP